MGYQGYDVSAAQALIPRLQRLLHAFRSASFPVYHTREGAYLHRLAPSLLLLTHIRSPPGFVNSFKP
jgi:nicotinamidase-related amidase